MLQMQTQSYDMTALDQMALNPVPCTLVTCSECSHLVPLTETVTYEIMEAIDGNQQNLSRENIRLTGRFGYECDACFLDKSQGGA